MDVLNRAEKIFDKVIIGYGTNPEKDQMYTDTISSYNIVHKKLQHYSAYSFSNISDFYKTLKNNGYENLTFVRGMRNAHDLHDEQQYQHYVRELTGADFVNILTSHEHMFTSSGAIRTLNRLGQAGTSITHRLTKLSS
jgi:phosphopantetheine adenylyltransferase